MTSKPNRVSWIAMNQTAFSFSLLLAGRAYATVSRLSVVCTECIVAKRCVLSEAHPHDFLRLLPDLFRVVTYSVL